MDTRDLISMCDRWVGREMTVGCPAEDCAENVLTLTLTLTLTLIGLRGERPRLPERCERGPVQRFNGAGDNANPNPNP